MDPAQFLKNSQWRLGETLKAGKAYIPAGSVFTVTNPRFSSNIIPIAFNDAEQKAKIDRGDRTRYPKADLLVPYEKLGACENVSVSPYFSQEYMIGDDRDVFWSDQEFRPIPGSNAVMAGAGPRTFLPYDKTTTIPYVSLENATKGVVTLLFRKRPPKCTGLKIVGRDPFTGKFTDHALNEDWVENIRAIKLFSKSDIFLRRPVIAQRIANKLTKDFPPIVGMGVVSGFPDKAIKHDGLCGFPMVKDGHYYLFTSLDDMMIMKTTFGDQINMIYPDAQTV